MTDWRSKLATPREVSDQFDRLLMEDDDRRAEAGEPRLPQWAIMELHRKACARAARIAEGRNE